MTKNELDASDEVDEIVAHNPHDDQLDSGDNPQTELIETHAKIAQAAKILLADAPQRSRRLGYDAAIRVATTGDEVMAGMVRLLLDLDGKDRETIDRELQQADGLTVGVELIDDPFVVEDQGGQLNPGEGIEGYLIGLFGTSRLPGNIPFVDGIALVTDGGGNRLPVPVGVLENGAVFLECDVLSQALAAL
jgi:hypothetical protein